MKGQTCSERVAAQMEQREEQIHNLFLVRDGDALAPVVREAFDLGVNDPLPEGADATEQAYDRLNELPLSVEVEHVVRIVLSTGGPHDEIRAYVRGGEMFRAEYAFQDWYEGATLPVLEVDSALWRYAEEIVEMMADTERLPRN